ncbi:MAG: hypothetical protein WBI40_00990 [Methylococcaceae bacterium]
MNLQTTNPVKTMSSVEIVKIINDMREEGAAVLTHDNFMKKVIKVLGEKDAVKFNAIYKDSMNREKPCYALPKREASLMVMSENYKVQAAVYDRMTELEQQVTQPKPLSPAEMFLEQAKLSVEFEKRISSNEIKVNRVEAKIEQISVDLRNGVPRGFISRANALKMYSQGLSKEVFEKALTAYEVPTKHYVHYADGHSTPTFAYQEDRIVTVINHFIRELVQETKCQCYSKLLNKRVNYKKPVLYGLKDDGAITGGLSHA